MRTSRPIALARALALGIMLAVPAMAKAQQDVTLFDNFRASDGGYQPIYGYFASTGGPFAMKFVTPPGDPTRLDYIQIAVQAVSFGGPQVGGVASVRVSLRSNTAQQEPGAVLDAVERYDIARAPLPYAAGTYSFQSSAHPELAAATPYWVMMENIGDDTLKPFWYLSFGADADMARFQDAGWFQFSRQGTVMRVIGEQLPEPSATLPVAVGAAVSATRRRRKS